MKCTRPIVAWYGEKNFKTGKRGLVFKHPSSSPNRLGDLEIPCGRCIDCKLEYSRQWAVRCVHESKLHECNCFVTLTYDDFNLPQNGSLYKKDLQNFYKRLRKRISPRKIRHYSAGEYGDETFRPHYHAIIFNYCPSDRVFYKKSKIGTLYKSAELDAIWQKGGTTFGEVSFESAAYCARYATKKITGERAATHYRRVDSVTGEVVNILPEFACMSLGKKNDSNPNFRGGIGHGFYLQFKDDIYPSDEVISRGKRAKPPKFYDRKLSVENPDLHESLKEKRVRKAKERGKPTERELIAHEKISRAKLSLKKGNL